MSQIEKVQPEDGGLGEWTYILEMRSSEGVVRRKNCGYPPDNNYGLRDVREAFYFCWSVVHEKPSSGDLLNGMHEIFEGLVEMPDIIAWWLVGRVQGFCSGHLTKAEAWALAKPIYQEAVLAHKQREKAAAA